MHFCGISVQNLMHFCGISVLIETILSGKAKLFLCTYMQVFGLGFVIELLRDEAAQTQNQTPKPLCHFEPHYREWFMWLDFLIHAFPFE